MHAKQQLIKLQLIKRNNTTTSTIQKNCQNPYFYKRT